MKEDKKMDTVINDYLKKNPGVKKAMKVFGMSMKEYKTSIEALTQKRIITSTSSTNLNGNMERNN